MKIKTARGWITKLNLQAYPQGGYFRQVYRSVETIPAEALPARFVEAHTFSTAIYFLLEAGQISPLHRIKSDELWHFYHGAPLTLHIFSPDGDYAQIELGPDIDSGQVFQAVAPANHWFGATVTGAYSLVGCTVAPGFEISDFELGRRDALLAKYPQHRRIIELLTGMA